jgi:hypothetical protein
MQFEPMGGFPPIIRIDDDAVSEKTLESRGFASANVVDISNIMKAKKKEDYFIAFDSEEEKGVIIDSIFDENPSQYNKIDYKEMPKRLAKANKRTKSQK